MRRRAAGGPAIDGLVLDASRGHPSGEPASKCRVQIIRPVWQMPLALKGATVPTLWSVDVVLPASVRPLELDGLASQLEYLCARVVLDDGRRVVRLQVLADDRVGAQRYARERVEALLSVGDALHDLPTRSGEPPSEPQ